ncbi:hypothetical protein LTR85_007707 [Meristemomyces frigidus]|nr:hypothetical protein LTR85_007707 [Meristemomyces frigidus]
MGLTDLPPELILRMSSLLTTPELGTLRRASKFIEAVLFDSFAREFFGKRQFMIEHVSLQCLVDISNHPTLSARLAEVIIGLDVLQTDSDSDYSSDRSRARYIAGHASRRVLLETGQARDMLEEAFSKLPNLRTVGLRDYAGAGRYRDGADAVWRSYGWSYDYDSDGLQTSHPRSMSLASPESAFPLILYAVGRANARPTNIEVFLRKRSKLTPLALNVVDGLMAPAVVPVLAGLKKLLLTVSLSERYSYGTPSAGASNDRMADVPLKRLLLHTPNLQVLRINFENDQPLAQDFLEWLGTPASTPAPTADVTHVHVSPVALAALTHLDLGMLSVQGPTLVKVVAKLKLTSLNLWKVSLQCKDVDEFEAEPNRWRQFFENFAAALPADTALTTMMVGYPYQCYYGDPKLTFSHESTRIQFSPERSQRSKTPLDTVSYRGGYGASIKDWMLSMVERTSAIVLPSADEDSESESDDDGDGVDVGDIDEDEDESEDEDA